MSVTTPTKPKAGASHDVARTSRLSFAGTCMRERGPKPRLAFQYFSSARYEAHIKADRLTAAFPGSTPVVTWLLCSNTRQVVNMVSAGWRSYVRKTTACIG
jgi:hypothetical protein